MKCLSLLQPWASLCVTTDPKTGKAYKQIETRSWNTKYRGPLLIHASKAWKPEQEKLLEKPFFGTALQDDRGKIKMKTGAIIGMVNLVDTFKMGAVWGMIQQNMKISIGGRVVDFSEQEIAFGDYSSQKRYGWLLSDPILFKTPIPCKGNLSIWNLPVELEGQVMEQIRLATIGMSIGVPAEYHSTAIASPGEGAVIVEGVSSSTDYYNAFPTIHPEGGFDKLTPPEKDNIYLSKEAMEHTKSMWDEFLMR